MYFRILMLCQGSLTGAVAHKALMQILPDRRSLQLAIVVLRSRGTPGPPQDPPQGGSGGARGPLLLKPD